MGGIVYPPASRLIPLWVLIFPNGPNSRANSVGHIFRMSTVLKLQGHWGHRLLYWQMGEPIAGKTQLVPLPCMSVL